MIIMINVGMYYKVKAGHEKEFESIFEKVLSTLKEAEIGFKNGRLYRDVKTPSEYLIYTEWDSIEKFRAFMQSNNYKSTVEHGRTIIEGRPKHIILTPSSE